MYSEKRKFPRIDFESTIEMEILEPISSVAYIEDASVGGLRVITDLNLIVGSKLVCRVSELNHALPFHVSVAWKCEDGQEYYAYGLRFIEDEVV